MGVVNYMRVVLYRKCNDCGFVDDDFHFNHYIHNETENTALFEVQNYCPVCDSHNLSDLFYDEELTRPYTPPQYNISP